MPNEMRDRLIELLKKADSATWGDTYESYADYLIANGVILPPCKVGNEIYRLACKKNNTFTIVDNEVGYFEINKEGFWIVDDMENYFALSDIGKTVFLTEQEAREALRKEDEGK